MNDDRKLKDLGPGDEVYRIRSFSRTPEIMKIDRVTATQIIVRFDRGMLPPREVRYNRETGRIIGEKSFDADYIHPLTEKDAARFREDAEIARLAALVRTSALNLSSMSTEKIKKIGAERLKAHLSALQEFAKDLDGV